jgi:hypothetical protein
MFSKGSLENILSFYFSILDKISLISFPVTKRDVVEEDIKEKNALRDPRYLKFFSKAITNSKVSSRTTRK